MPKVLIVDSVDDAITDRRRALLDESSLLKQQKITLAYCCAVDLTSQQRFDLEFKMRPDYLLAEDSLFERINQAIKSAKPKYVFAHSGFVYHDNPQVYNAAFSRLKKLYSKIKFGLQLRGGMEFNEKIFDMDDSTKQIHDFIFILALEKK
ncbi:MAG TPA: hypothetical protein VK815_08215 [Candidatus Acidoferrales bacterium]|jgi:hypothetical protein|nr:hypothetical protein [Candidatus Acidoferrales bacterium]